MLCSLWMGGEKRRATEDSRARDTWGVSLPPTPGLTWLAGVEKVENMPGSHNVHAKNLNIGICQMRPRLEGTKKKMGDM